MKLASTCATLSLIAALGLPALDALGQSRGERVDQIAAALSGGISDNTSSTTQVEYTDAATGQVIRATPAQLLRKTITNVDFDTMAGRLALEIWSTQTGIPVVVNWAALESQGIDPAAPVTLKLSKVPADLVLKLIIQQLHPDPLGDDALLVQVEPWYIHVMTREEALRRTTTKIYSIADLLMDIPNFTNAPQFDLNEALSNTSTGGSNGRSGGGQDQGIFSDDDEENGEPELSKEEKAERIVELIRSTIEPDIWLENGGEYASVRYLRGMLVVKAPKFVHEQIGGVTGQSTTAKTATAQYKSTARNTNSKPADAKPTRRRSSSGNVAGVAPARKSVRR